MRESRWLLSRRRALLDSIGEDQVAGTLLWRAFIHRASQRCHGRPCRRKPSFGVLAVPEGDIHDLAVADPDAVERVKPARLLVEGDRLTEGTARLGRVPFNNISLRG